MALRMLVVLFVYTLSFSSLFSANWNAKCCCHFSHNENKDRKDFVYYPGMTQITKDNTPDITNKSYFINADVEGRDGVIVKQGEAFKGWGLLVIDGKPLFFYANQRIQSPDALTPIAHNISFDFTYDGGIGKGGEGTLKVDGKVVAQERIENTTPQNDSFTVGMDAGLLVKSVRIHLTDK